jgi:hypothetical protein
MPTTLYFTSGLELKVTADLPDLERPLGEGGAVSLRRFAGFRGTELVDGEAVVVRMDEVAYAQAIPMP